MHSFSTLECAACRGHSGADHNCAFRKGRFDAQNWKCVSMTQLLERGVTISGDEVMITVVPGPRGRVAELIRRVGEPERVRLAHVISPTFGYEALTLEFVEATLALDLEFDRRLPDGSSS